MSLMQPQEKKILLRIVDDLMKLKARGVVYPENEQQYGSLIRAFMEFADTLMETGEGNPADNYPVDPPKPPPMAGPDDGMY